MTVFRHCSEVEYKPSIDLQWADEPHLADFLSRLHGGKANVRHLLKHDRDVQSIIDAIYGDNNES